MPRFGLRCTPTIPRDREWALYLRERNWKDVARRVCRAGTRTRTIDVPAGSLRVGDRVRVLLNVGGAEDGFEGCGLVTRARGVNGASTFATVTLDESDARRLRNRLSTELSPSKQAASCARASVALDAVVEVDGSSARVPIGDVSDSGIFVPWCSAPTPGTRVSVRFVAECGSLSRCVDAEVVWHGAKSGRRGAGLRFVTTHGREALQSMDVTRDRSDGAALEFPSARGEWEVGASSAA